MRKDLIFQGTAMNPSDMPLRSIHPVESFDSEDIVSSMISSSDSSMRSTTGIKTSIHARPLHRLAEKREEQNLSLTRVARKLNIDIAEARRQERPYNDLMLSELYRWRGVLEVPVGELIIEPDEIPSNPVKCRSQLVKMMKTARSILENSKDDSIQILARQLVDEMLELMPELKSISPWPTIGQAREHREPGQAALRRFDTNVSRRMEE